MSEDVKPRKSIGRNIVDEWDLKHFKRVPVVSSGFQYTIREDLIKMVNDELEPTMRMMDEMTKKLEEIENYLNFRTDDLVGDDLIGDKRHTIRFNSLLESINKTLEKYKKFKEGLR